MQREYYEIEIADSVAAYLLGCLDDPTSEELQAAELFLEDHASPLEMEEYGFGFCEYLGTKANLATVRGFI